MEIETIASKINDVGEGAFHLVEANLEDFVVPLNHTDFMDTQLLRMQGGFLDTLAGDRFRLLNAGMSEAPSLGSKEANDLVEANKVSLTGLPANAADSASLSPEDEAKLNRVAELVNDMNLSTMKFKVAWSVIQGLSKDIKEMLHAQ